MTGEELRALIYFCVAMHDPAWATQLRRFGLTACWDGLGWDGLGALTRKGYDEAASRLERTDLFRKIREPQ